MSKDTAIKIRDALVSSWVFGTEGPSPRAYVLAASSEGDLALFFAVRRIVVLLIPLETIPDWHTISTIEDRIRRLLVPAEGLFLGGARRVVHLVFLGGDPRIRSWIGQVQFRSESMKRAVAFHHVAEEEGHLDVWDASVPLPWLDTTLKRNPELLEQEVRPLSQAQLEALLEEGRVVVMENRAWGRVMRRPNPATRVLLVVVLGVFALQFYWSRGNPDGPAILWMMGACDGRLVAAGEYWRLVTAAFLHAGFLHLFLNLSVLLQLGILLERILGTRRFLVLYGLSAVGGFAASALFETHAAGVGASTALAGLIAAVAVMAWRHGSLFASYMVRPLRRDLAITLVLMGVISLIPGISLAGHLGGGVVGAVLMFSGVLVRGVEPVRRDGRRRWETGGRVREWRWDWLLTFGSALVVAVMVGSLVVGMTWTRPWELRDPPETTRVSVAHLGLSLELPQRLARPPVIDLERPDAVTFGTLGEDPMVVHLARYAVSSSSELANPRALLEHFASAAGMPDMTPIELPDGSVMFQGTEEMGDMIVMVVGTSVQGNALVTVTVARFAGVPEGWERVANEIPGTVQTESVEPIDLEGPGDLDTVKDWDRLQALALSARAAADLPLAEAVLRRMTVLRPKDASVWRLLGETYKAESRTTEAVAAFRKAVEVAPDDVEPCVQLGEALWDAEELVEAQSTFERCVTLSPSDPTARRGLGQVLLALEQPKAAVVHLEKARELQPGPFTSILLGRALIQAGHPDRAVEVFRQILAGSSDPMLENDIAYTLAENDTSLEWALQLARRSIRRLVSRLSSVTGATASWREALLTTSLGHVWDTLGTVQLRRGHLEEAAPYLLAAWSINRIGEEALHLGELWELRGKTEEAVTWYARSVTSAEGDTSAVARLKALLGDDATLDEVLVRHQAPAWPEQVTRVWADTPPDVRACLAKRLQLFVVLAAEEEGAPTERDDATGRKEVLAGAVIDYAVPEPGALGDGVRAFLGGLDTPVVFPSPDPVRLVLPARTICTPASGCGLEYLSPESVDASWGRSLEQESGTGQGEDTLPTEAR